MEEFSKSNIMRFSHVDTFFHSFNFFAFYVPVFSARRIRSALFASSAQLPYRFREGRHYAYKACINAVAILN